MRPELTCACYPSTPLHKLRVCSDFVNFLWHLDDLSDEMDDKGTVTIKDEVMATHLHPDTHEPKTDIGRLAKRFASIAYEASQTI